ncbi:hypothetical protein G9C98_006874 [Cotesia typhae]|uniref:V-type proton ATPase subunit S1 n=1 Tax=Cotesia typhae TaxID=2053667 RepID=A0A8J5QKL5_9HYME|nr:hypothetical protein G9C98_006874 [Cotesia typhae]
MLNLQLSVIKLLVLGFTVSTVTSSITDVPVLIWGGGSTTKSITKSFNLFDKTSQKDFKDIVTKKVGDSQLPIIVFYRDSFCREDVTLHDTDQWKQLEKFGSLEYVPEVESPLAVLEALQFYNQTVDEDLNSVSNGQLAINRANDLEYVAETFRMLKESSPHLIGILTDEGKDTADSPVVIKMDFDVTGNDTTSYKASLAFEIVSRSSGYYTLHRVNVTRDSKEYTLNTRENIVWPNNFSYHCAQVVQFSMPKVNDTEEIKLNLYNLQVQLFAKKFGDTYDCVGFTSISIWSGIFVTSILALIMIWGLVMMMDIRTMDRFDDSKGKTITISAQE